MNTKTLVHILGALLLIATVSGCNSRRGGGYLPARDTGPGTGPDTGRATTDGSVTPPMDTGFPGTDTGSGGFPPGALRVFVTSTRYNGNLGGFAGADSLCNLAAEAAGLPGTYRAWLSDSWTSAIDRMTGSGPWALPGSGTVMFNNHAHLATSPLGPIDENEHGAWFSSRPVEVWTGTTTGGRGTTSDCISWTFSDPTARGTIGFADTPSDWTEAGPVGSGLRCDFTAQLICFQQ